MLSHLGSKVCAVFVQTVFAHQVKNWKALSNMPLWVCRVNLQHQSLADVSLHFLCQVAGCTRMEPWSCLAAFPFSLKMSCCWQMAYQILFIHLIISACWLALAWRSPAYERVSVGSLSLKKSCSEYSSRGSGLHNPLARKLFSLSCPRIPFLPSHPHKKQGWEAFCIGILWVCKPELCSLWASSCIQASPSRKGVLVPLLCSADVLVLEEPA